MLGGDGALAGEEVVAGVGAKVAVGLIGLAVIAAIAGGGDKKPEEDANGIPIRDWSSSAKYMAERRVKNLLRDPGSAEFRNLRVYTQTNPRQRAVCGEVNSKNGFGGYVGFAPFVAIVTYEGVQPNGDTEYLTRAYLSADPVDVLLLPRLIPLHCRESGGETAPPAPPLQFNRPEVTNASTGTPAGSSQRAIRMKQTGNVRASASGSATVVRTATAGTTLRIFSTAGAWHEVGDSQPWGWVHSSLVEALP